MIIDYLRYEPRHIKFQHHISLYTFMLILRIEDRTTFSPLPGLSKV